MQGLPAEKMLQPLYTSICFLLFLLAIGGNHLHVTAASPPHQEAASFYQVLKLAKGATDTEVKRAYRKLSLELHPDKVKAKNGDTKAAEELFQQINRAYQVLSNSKSRRLFDTYGPLYETQESYYEELQKNRMHELYSYKRGVHLLHGPNMDALLRGSEFSWIISFYQAGCGNCERRVRISSTRFSRSPVSRQAQTQPGRIAENMATSAFCLMHDTKNLRQLYIQQDLYPCPRLFCTLDSWDFEEYSGPMSVSDILKAADQLKASRLEEASSDRHVKEQLRKLPSAGGAGGISAVWIVDYYRPSCPPCRQLRAELRRLSRTLSQQIRITLVNCDLGRCDVPHYPYLRLFVKQ
ncbi:hypothetical protein cyc_01785 [Cyclospora cayetanensis]|uniref:DnaJ homolog subfamily C member 16 n=1 Tax=Cyclospora cayetanensis TaxID=88456 RepID=A0A1D3D5Y6_9EIME|nr:hypothetical protein cyc_01785 [Cyclospora cayetanensis]